MPEGVSEGSPLEAALSYAERGLRVLPVWGVKDGKCTCNQPPEKCSPGKHPLSRLVPRGVRDATADAAVIRGWWEQYPLANVGIAMGPESGVIGADIDTYQGGMGTLGELTKKHGAAPKTWRALTGGGGEQAYFAYPEVGTETLITLGAGLALRGANYYMVAPPSMHTSGRPYKWIKGPGDVELAPLPEWMLRSATKEINGNTPAAEIPEKFPEGSRNPILFSIAGSLRRRGATEDEIYEALLVFNRSRSENPHGEEEIRRIAHSMCTQYAAGSPLAGGGLDIAEPLGQLRSVPVGDFAAVQEAGAKPVLGTSEDCVIPQGGDVITYGDGGAGKTTLMIDLACHLAAGDEWFGIPVPRRFRVCLVENEGPRPRMRKKLEQKMAGWTGSPIGKQLHVLEEPWGKLTFADEEHRAKLARHIAEEGMDVLVAGPAVRLGMNEAGTLQQVRDFMLLIAEVRRLSERPLTVILVHHENKRGQVSGAFEGAAEATFHVKAHGNGQTRLLFQKTRWSSEWHGKSLNLRWTEGNSGGFEVDDEPEYDHDDLRAMILAHFREYAGGGWTECRKAVPGRKADLDDLRDGLLAEKQLVALLKEDGVDRPRFTYERHARIYCADDPVVAHFLPESRAITNEDLYAIDDVKSPS